MPFAVMEIGPLEFIGIQKDVEEVDGYPDGNVPPIQNSRVMALQPVAAFDVGDGPGEKADDHDQEKQVHHGYTSPVSR